MPKTKRLPKDVLKNHSVVLKDGRVEGNSERPELAVLTELHLRPVAAEWAYLQKFNDLLACYALLNQVKGAVALLDVAYAVGADDPELGAEARRQLPRNKSMERNVDASLEAVAQVLQERGFRKA